MTVAVAPLKLKDWFGDNVRSYFCVNPVSISPQPVHALSSFMSKVTEISGQRRLSEVARLIATKNGLWAISNETLRATVRFELPSSDRDLEQLRHGLAGLLAADGAVFKSPFSFQLAHVALAAADRTDNGLGELSARLVLSREDGRDALNGVIDRLFERQRNPHWAVSSVLVDTRREDVQVASRIDPPPWSTDPQCAGLAKQCGDLLVRALSLIADGHDTLLSLRVLATSLAWVGLLVYAQVPSLSVEGEMSPLLAEAGDPGQLPGLRDASAASRRALNGSWERWLAHKLAESLSDLFDGKDPDDSVMRAFIQQTEPYRIMGGSTNPWGRSSEVYANWRQNNATFIAAGYTLEDMLAASMGNKPQKWFDAVGRHCGFIGPRRGHPARFRAEVSLLPTLVLAGMAESDGGSLPMVEWMDRLIERFGVVLSRA